MYFATGTLRTARARLFRATALSLPVFFDGQPQETGLRRMPGTFARPSIRQRAISPGSARFPVACASSARTFGHALNRQRQWCPHRLSVCTGFPVRPQNLTVARQVRPFDSNERSALWVTRIARRYCAPGRLCRKSGITFIRADFKILLFNRRSANSLRRPPPLRISRRAIITNHDPRQHIGRHWRNPANGQSPRLRVRASSDAVEIADPPDDETG